MELQLFQADVTNVTQHVTSRVRDVTEDCTTPLICRDFPQHIYRETAEPGPAKPNFGNYPSAQLTMATSLAVNSVEELKNSLAHDTKVKVAGE